MSNSRCHVKIAFSIYGEDFKHEMSINYSPECDGGCDSRISDLFVEWERRARSKFIDREHEAKLRREERDERELLRYLKGKYETDDRRGD